MPSTSSSSLIDQDSLENVLPGKIYIKCSPSPNLNDEQANDRYMEFNKTSETTNVLLAVSSGIFFFITVILLCISLFYLINYLYSNWSSLLRRAGLKH